MAVLSLSLSRGTLRCPTAPDLPWEGILDAQIARLPRAAPIAILIHGFKFSPSSTRTDPNRYIFAADRDHPRPRFKSWPRGLGFSPTGPDDGLCIGFGWPAGVQDNPRRRGRSVLARVYDRAAEAGLALSGVLDTLAAIAPGREVDLIAHSLGARVALAALAATRGTAGQVILMGGAEYRPVAHAALARARPTARIYNITSRENDVFDALFRTFGPAEHRGAAPLSGGLGHLAANCIDLPLDRAEVAPMFARRGARLAGPVRRVCHWHFYTRPGALDLYRRMIRERHNWTLPELKDELAGLAGPARWRLPLPRIPGAGPQAPGQTTAA